MKEIKLVSYNLDHSSKKDKLIRNICSLAETEVNIFCFQELRTNPGEPFIGDTILESLGEQWQGRFLISRESKNDYGLGVIWDSTVLKLSDFQALDLPSLAQLSLSDRLIEQYLLSGDAKPVKRAALISTFLVNGQQVRVSNLHADWHGGFEQRFTQIRYLMDYLKSVEVDSEVICGDFNTIGLFRSTRQIQKIQELLGPEFINILSSSPITSTHGQRLDHIFARNFKQGYAKVHKILGSDHFPVAAVMEFPERL